MEKGFDFDNTHSVKIDGVVSIPNTMTVDEFTDLFLAWCEEKGFAFGGGTGLLLED